MGTPGVTASCESDNVLIQDAIWCNVRLINLRCDIEWLALLPGVVTPTLPPCVLGGKVALAANGGHAFTFSISVGKVQNDCSGRGRGALAELKIMSLSHRLVMSKPSHLAAAALVAIAGIALGLCLVSLPIVPTNVTADEADNLQVVYHILEGHGPGFFGLDSAWTGSRPLPSAPI